MACLFWMVSEMGDKWPYSYFFVECGFQDLFKIARSILVWSLSSFFSISFVSFHVVHPYSSIDTTPVFILFYRIDQTSI